MKFQLSAVVSAVTADLCAEDSARYNQSTEKAGLSRGPVAKTLRQSAVATAKRRGQTGATVEGRVVRDLPTQILSQKAEQAQNRGAGPDADNFPAQNLRSGCS
jgi:hypothetical protein